MEPLRYDVDPFANEPARWGASLVNLGEIIIPCLDAARVQSVMEVGAYAGDLTRLLLAWARDSGAHVRAIDPSPRPPLEQLAAECPELELVRETSLETLGRLPAPDAVVIDGDHNWYTVSAELRLLAERAGDRLPLIFLHDVCWPHGRRDDYYAPELIPPEHRHETSEGGGLFPGVEGIRPGALPYRWPAAREGGARNGVLTAVEDFVAGREGVRLAVIPAFFGLGIVWDESAPYAEALAAIVDRWDRNPLLERLETNRVLHLASAHFQLMEAVHARARVQRQEAVLRRLLESSAFAFAERLSRLRHRAGIDPEQRVISRDEVRRALASDPTA